MIEIILEAWGWTGIDPKEIIGVNQFGNMIVKDAKGAYWRVCPEDVYCELIAINEDEYSKLCNDTEFIEDWEMEAMCTEARGLFGTPSSDRCYCLKIPGILGGEYGGSNLSTITIEEVIKFSGYLGKQIKDLPEGAEIKLDVVP